jgi:arylsulfatase A-like enzyme
LAALYEGEIAYLDHHVGRLLDGLAERGILEHAIVVVTADHGETFWEHGDFWNHGLWVYDTTVRVPLLVRLPVGEAAGREVTVPVSTVDILPTLCDLLGIEGPKEAEGVSLVPALRGEAFERAPVFSEATQPWGLAKSQLAGTNPKAPSFWANGYKPHCVRVGSCKYIRAPYVDHEELYDLARDPGERVNLIGASDGCAGDVDRLRAVLKDWTDEAAPLPSGYDATQVGRIVERLRGLGYAGAEDGADDER